MIIILSQFSIGFINHFIFLFDNLYLRN